ncbi:MAG: heat-shock protein [Betaproteobacteria bacterium RIFCSPLOWO2_02_FULL_66_14]|nr:MAG: heat-shock protein [Betaproteobacteria bacterium RIFCSPLOWO2_02_FULL_66_14]
MTEHSAITRDAPPEREQPALLPPVDVIEDSTGITLFADLPGVPKERLNLHLESDTLTIEGEMGLDMPKDMIATHAEVGMPRYRRVFTLSKELDTQKLSAEMKQGVLRIHIQKVEQAKPRRIQVNVG